MKLTDQQYRDINVEVIARLDELRAKLLHAATPDGGGIRNLNLPLAKMTPDNLLTLAETELSLGHLPEAFVLAVMDDMDDFGDD